MNKTMADGTIIHTGKVTQVSAEGYTIRIDGADKCGECAIAAFCRSNGSEYIKTEIKSCDDKLEEGDDVRIEITPTMVWKAILFACALPLLIILAAITSAKLLDASDTAAAAVGITAVALYFFIIYATKSLRSRKYSLKVYRLTN